MRQVLPLVLLAVAGCREAAPAATPVRFDTPAITLPADAAGLPATPAGELVTVNCTACHSAEMIRQQPMLPAKAWAATVKKMREAYHAPIAPGDDAAIVRALVGLQAAGGRN